MNKIQACAIIAYAQNSRAPCDLDMQANDMVLVHNTLSCNNDHLWLKIL